MLFSATPLTAFIEALLGDRHLTITKIPISLQNSLQSHHLCFANAEHKGQHLESCPTQRGLLELKPGLTSISMAFSLHPEAF